jgi:hypothetical protein
VLAAGLTQDMDALGMPLIWRHFKLMVFKGFLA